MMRKPWSFLSTIVAQVISGSAELRDEIQNLWRSHNDGLEKPTVDKLMPTLSSIIRRTGREAYFVFDALDGCMEETGETSQLHLGIEIHVKSKLSLFTSRVWTLEYKAEIEDALILGTNSMYMIC